MLTALRCQPQPFFRQDRSDGGMDFLRCFIAGVGADLFAQYLTGRTANDNDVPTVQPGGSQQLPDGSLTGFANGF